MEISIPRDRTGTFEPEIIPKYATRFDGLDEKIISLNMTLRKVIKNKRMFPSDEAVFKLLFLAIERISQKWTMPIHNWKPAMNRFMIEFGDRVTG